ncbi:MFS transporter [soil metagenome]
MAEPGAGRRIALLFSVLAVVFVAALDLTVVAPILPQVISDLGINTVDADRYSWIVLSYLVAYTVTVPLTGRVSDYLGRIPVFLIATALFAAGSVVTAIAGTLGEMVAGRVLQGLGGGAMLPVSMALVADVTPRIRRAEALGLVAAIDTFGWVLGPVWGAGINAAFGSWRAVFWLNVPLCVVVAIWLLVARGNLPGRTKAGLPNLVSASLAATALTAFSLALSSGGEPGMGPEQGTRALGGSANPLAAYRWPLLGLAVATFAGFVVSEARSRIPLIPRHLIRARIFQFSGIANILVGGALITAMVNAPLVVALLADEDDQPLLSALLLGSFTLMMTIGAVAGGRFTTRGGARRISAIGLLVAAAGFGVMSFWPNDLQMGLMCSTMAITGLGLGIVIAPIAESAISAASIEDYGIASGLVLLARLIGMTIGLSAVTRYAVERLEMRTSALPSLRPMEGESTADYFTRQQAYVEEHAVPLTLEVIHETFLVAGLICLATIVAVYWMRQRRSDRISSGVAG